MRVDGNIGGSIDGTGSADLAGISDQVAAAERVGYDGVWTTEVSRDPFLPLLLAADRSQGLTLGTAVAIAFARIDERELIAKVRTHIDRYKVPKSIIVVEELPKTSTGKIQKNAVRDKFAGHYSTG